MSIGWFAGMIVTVLAGTASFQAGASQENFVIGEAIVLPEDAPDPSKPVIRMLVTQFARPNLHYPLIFSTTQTLQKLFGKNNVEVRGFLRILKTREQQFSCT